MDLLAGRAEPQNVHLDSPHMRAIKEAFRKSVEDGFEAGLEALLSMSHPDCEFRPYIGDHTLRGHEEIRAYYREAIAAGTDMRLRPTQFHDAGDEVVVDGTMRVGRPTGGFSESQISWTYRFRDGRLAAASSGPRRVV